MKRSSKIILFIAVTAITFGTLNLIIGRRYCDGGFRNHRGCGNEMQDRDSRPTAGPAVKTI